MKRGVALDSLLAGQSVGKSRKEKPRDRYPAPAVFRKKEKQKTRARIAEKTLRAKAVSKVLSPDCRANRVGFINAGLLAFVLIIVGRLYDLQSQEHGKWSGLASRQSDTSLEIQGARGNILDTTGRALAVSVESVALGAHPNRIENKDALAEELARITNVESKTLLQTISNDKSFVWMARGLPLQVKHELEAYKGRGLEVYSEFKRYYPQGGLAGTLLGRIGRDGQGLSGLELSFDKQLVAKSEMLDVKRDARGRFITPSLEEEGGSPFAFIKEMGFKKASLDLPEELSEEAPLRKEGDALQLTIDSYIQGILEEEFRLAQAEANAKAVYGVVMDARNGEILALAQSPAFNPNQPDANPEALKNFTLQNSFEPGSTMKPLVAAVALQEKKVKANEVMDCEMGRYKVGPHIIKDVHPVGIAGFDQVLIRSSNVCMAKLGQRLGAQKLFASLQNFGFGKTPNVGIKGEAGGIFRHVSNWREIDVATHSFGQGISVTALQLAGAYASLANGGLVVKPKLIKSDETQTTRVLDTDVANTIADILSGVIEDEHGTGKKAGIPGVKIGGKTGTAQKAKLNGRGYDPDKVLSSFIGFTQAGAAGVSKPLVMLVLVDEPTVRPRWGGVVAAPAFRRSMKRILSYLITLKSESGESESGLLQTATINSGTKDKTS